MHELLGHEALCKLKRDHRDRERNRMVSLITVLGKNQPLPKAKAGKRFRSSREAEGREEARKAG
jgi:hypothetical protein